MTDNDVLFEMKKRNEKVQEVKKDIIAGQSEWAEVLKEKNQAENAVRHLQNKQTK